ncbi:MAG: hypothetical protein AAGG38_05615 [Planctomycetota bacterium]
MRINVNQSARVDESLFQPAPFDASLDDDPAEPTRAWAGWCLATWLWAALMFAVLFLPTMFTVLAFPTKSWWIEWCMWLQLHRVDPGYLLAVEISAAIGIGLAALSGRHLASDTSRSRTPLVWAAVVILSVMGLGVGLEPLAFGSEQGLGHVLNLGTVLASDPLAVLAPPPGP